MAFSSIDASLTPIRYMIENAVGLESPHEMLPTMLYQNSNPAK
jgi:hypothetical protein